MNSWHSYPSIYNLGHAALEPIAGMPLQVEEKIDGSQFSFGRFGGELRVRSKGKEMIADAPEKMFAAGVEHVKTLDLRDGWTYRGEFLGKPKHNTLAYERIPTGHVIIFDINPAEESYLSYEEKQAEAARVGLECVPRLHTGVMTTNKLKELLDTQSVLGNVTIEGVVLKQYSLFGPDKKVLMAKFVSEAFKEKHSRSWKVENPGQSDIVDNIIAELRTDARFTKTVQHLRDDGVLTGELRDIPALMKELSTDTYREEETYIKELLFKWAWPKIQRGVQRGLPEWYKQHLAETQLGGSE